MTYLLAAPILNPITILDLVDVRALRRDPVLADAIVAFLVFGRRPILRNAGQAHDGRLR
jgi:hypothetical protein